MATKETVFYSQEAICTYMTKGGIALVFTNHECTVPAEYVDELTVTANDPQSPIALEPRAADNSVAEQIKQDAAKKAQEVLSGLKK